MNSTKPCRKCGKPLDAHRALCKLCYKRAERHEKGCIRCGKKFSAYTKTTLYCSKKCRSDASILARLGKKNLAEIPKEKRCPKCGETKQAEWFSVNQYSKDGLYSHCRDCCQKKNQRWRLNTPDHRDRARESNLRRQYGIGIEDYEKILQQQGGVCGLCRRPPREGSRRMAVEHDHFTGEIRGIVHSYPCNVLLISNHSLHTAQTLLSYLEAPPARDAFGGVRIIERGGKTGRRKPPL